MAKKTSTLLPATAARLRRLGERLRMARLRRRIPAKQVAERAGMSPMTLRSLERGGAGVTIGAYVAVLQVLGFDEDLDLLANDDSVGRSLQDTRLSLNRWAELAASSSSEKAQRTRRTVTSDTHLHRETEGKIDKATNGLNEAIRTWANRGGILTTDELASVIEPLATSSKTKKKKR